MGTLLHDLRHGWRMLTKNPAVALVAIATLAVGIGANTAIFSVADALLWKPLAFPRSDRLVMVMERRVEQQSGWIPAAPGNWLDWKARNRSFQSLSAWEYGSANLTDAGEPERLERCRVSADLFNTLGVAPTLGRTFLPGEEQMGHDQVAVLSHRLWERKFSSAPDLLGKVIHLDGRAFTVIGIMPAAFDFPQETQIWTPLALPPPVLHLRGAKMLFGIARLKPGVSVRQAYAEMDGITRALEKQYPRSNEGWRATVFPLHQFLIGDLASYSRLLLGVALFALLIACANVANLQLSRGTARVREIAVRNALGAGRRRLLQQLLTESLCLSVAGGALGLLLAVWSVDLIRTELPLTSGIAGFQHIAVDVRTLAFALALALGAGILSGLAPSFQLLKRDMGDALKEGARGAGAGRSRHLARSLLAAAEIALALVLVTGASLMVKGFAGLVGNEQYLHPESLLTMRINLPETKYHDSRQVAEFYDELLARIDRLPGMKAAAVSTAIPHSGYLPAIAGFTREGAAANGDEDVCISQSVSPDYFRAMDVRLRQGRGFSSHDTAGAPMVAVISESMALRFWPGQDPLGRRLRLAIGDGMVGPWLTIVGVADDVIYNSFDRTPRPALYVPQAQDPSRSTHVVMRTAGAPAALIPAVQAEVHALDPEQPVYQVETMDQLGRDQLFGLQAIGLLMSFFGGLALLLAAVGIYGVMSASVTERTHEIGVRVALGASVHAVTRHVLSRSLRITAAGVCVGLVAAFVLARALRNLIFGVSATDPMVFTVIPVVLATVALLAAYLPARRAARVDPLLALRYE